MKNKMLLAALILCAGIIGSASAKELKVLAIGNSFSVCVGKYFSSVVQSFPEHSLEFTSACIGGCPLEKHARNIKEDSSDNDPKAGKYWIAEWSVSKGSPVRYQSSFGKLPDLLKNHSYDIVTIQQASPLSWKWESYEPYAGELIAFIRQCQPKAEIVIQETWSYRIDSPQLRRFGFDQTEMYERLRAAYKNLAEKYKFRVIPTGDAVQLFRKYTPVKYRKPEGMTFEYPNLPSREGDVVGSASWSKEEKDRKMKVDPIHLNPDGEYLQACVWFSILYGEPVDRITWAPKDMKPDFAALLRKCAKEAVESYQQVQ